MKKNKICLVIFLFISFGGFAQQKPLEDMSLEELLNTPIISIVTKTDLSQRETPGIVTLITENEIKKSGARDLTDVLRFVSGIEFGSDIVSQTNMIVRGLWASEGKIMMQINGHTQNEYLFSNVVSFGNRIPIEAINRIEIIRGPGSAIYGGMAEFMVVNIITKNGEDLEGIEVNAQYGQLSKSYGRRNISVTMGRQVSEDFSFDMVFFTGEGVISDKKYTDVYGGTYDLAKGSTQNPLMFIADANYKNWIFSYYAEKYRMDTQDAFDAILTQPKKQTFFTNSFIVGYQGELTNNLTVSPKITYTYQRPWEIKFGEPESWMTYEKEVTRSKGEIIVNYRPVENLDLLFGTEFYKDYAVSNDTVSGKFGKNLDENTVSYYNYAGFFQGTFSSEIANVTVGARYDKHNKYGSSIVPRIGLTKVFDKWHAKLLASRAFRAPGVENLRSELTLQDLKPELTTVFEFELGYQVTPNFFITTNLFDISVDKPIVYFAKVENEVVFEGFSNESHTGSRGFEIEAKYKDEHNYVTTNYSYYNIAGKNGLENYVVPEHAEQYLGSPQHKLSFLSCYSFTEDLSINPSVIFLSSKYTFDKTDENGDLVLSKLPAVSLVNIYLLKQNFLFEGLDAGFGVYDLLDSDYVFGAATNGYHASIPAQGREFIVRLNYAYSF